MHCIRHPELQSLSLQTPFRVMSDPIENWQQYWRKSAPSHPLSQKAKA